ncbi:CHAD domain-containing protein [Caenispirillum bisanense]|uniref:CYTH and CHAD domain-containing protein n=1 Tax=Caenispirillum bisanense TaxID=414052 RepID=UPI0031D49026
MSQPDDNTEIELKLEVAPDDMERLRRHSLVRRTRKGRPHTQPLKSVYFDTPDFLLFDGGASLRVRHAGRRRIQNVKARGDGSAGLFSRKEWEHDISGDTPDPQAILATGLQDLFGRPGVLDELRPLFVTEFKRTTYTLGNGTWEVALTFDRGAVTADGGSQPISEIELELVRGDPAHLFEIARALHEAAPLRLSTRSKSERGYALLGGGLEQDPVKAPDIPVTADMPLREAIQTICRSCQRHLLHNEPALRDRKEPEAVHQMRVALRRLRSALSVFRQEVAGAATDSLTAGLKWLTAELGPARDTDVFIAEILGPVREAHPGEDGLPMLLQRFEKRRGQHYRRAIAAVDSHRFTDLMLELGGWIEGGPWLHPASPELAARLDRPVGGRAAELLDVAHAKVLKKGKRFGSLDAASRHRLRVRIKKLRYAAEFFGDLWSDKKTRAYVKTLKELQEHLGALNDIAVAHDQLHSAVDKDADRREVWAAGLVAGWHGGRETALLEAARAEWKSFTDAKPFWPPPAKAAAKAEKAAEQAARASKRAERADREAAAAAAAEGGADNDD